MSTVGSTTSLSTFRNKASVVTPFLLGLTFVLLAVYVSHWYYLGYAALGIIIGRLMYGKEVEPVVGDFILAITGWMYTWIALIACWQPQYKDMNLVQILRKL
ncbi:MAG: hypothetical protein JWN38_1148 [Candidatus Saccharibacteria bacterium]|nr:hypothetical protein [Candidatus Saccharibacteria bacterium]